MVDKQSESPSLTPSNHRKFRRILIEFLGLYSVAATVYFGVVATGLAGASNISWSMVAMAAAFPVVFLIPGKWAPRATYYRTANKIIRNDPDFLNSEDGRTVA